MASSSELIPSLPFDIALNCLLRVPLHCYSTIAQVCRSWRSLASSPSFFQTRLNSGYTDNYACLIQAIHAPSPISPGKTPTNGITIYDSRRRAWHRLPAIPDFADGLPLFCQCAAVGCKLVLLGGWDRASCAVLRCVYVYDLSAGQWRKGCSMPSSRSFFACTATGGGRVVVAGGHDDNKNALRTVDAYDVETDQWQALADMNEERDECKAVVVGGKLAVVSGFSTESQGQFGRTAEVYDEEEKAWKVVENAWPAGIPPSSVAALKGDLYACFESKLMKYRAKDGQWEAIIELPREISTLACVIALKESVLISGCSGGGQPVRVFEWSVGSSPCQWRRLEMDSNFSGVVQAGCTVEL